MTVLCFRCLGAWTESWRQGGAPAPTRDERKRIVKSSNWCAATGRRSKLVVSLYPLDPEIAGVWAISGRSSQGGGGHCWTFQARRQHHLVMDTVRIHRVRVGTMFSSAIRIKTIVHQTHAREQNNPPKNRVKMKLP